MSKFIIGYWSWLEREPVGWCYAADQAEALAKARALSDLVEDDLGSIWAEPWTDARAFDLGLIGRDERGVFTEEAVA